jgi:hypothetical protein
MLGAPHDITDAYLQTTHEGRAVQYQDGMRWGTGEVQIAGIEILDAELKPVSFAETGRPHAIRIDLVAEQPVIGPEVILSIYDQHATLVTEVSTRSRDAHIDQVHGRRAVTLQIESLPLTEGTYELSCAVVDESGRREYDVRSRFVRFDVLKGAVDDRGLVTLGGTWDLGSS